MKTLTSERGQFRRARHRICAKEREEGCTNDVPIDNHREVPLSASESDAYAPVLRSVVTHGRTGCIKVKVPEKGCHTPYEPFRIFL